MICGSVELSSLLDVYVRGVRAQFRGESYVYWQNRTEDADGRSGMEIVKDHHTVWNQLFTVWGNKGMIMYVHCVNPHFELC